MELQNRIGGNKPVALDLLKYLGGDKGVQGVAGPAEIIKLYLEPVIDIFVQFIIFIAYFQGSAVFLLGLHLRSRPVLICSRHEQCVIPTQPAVTRITIC